MLDALGRRYGQLPSDILCIDRYESKAFIINAMVMKAAMDKVSEMNTTKGKIDAKRARYDPEAIMEMREAGMIK